MVAAFDQTSLELLFHKPDVDGSFAGPALAHFRALGRRKPMLLLCFPPKAAGTFLRQAACEAVGGYHFRMTHAQGGRDATPYLPTFVSCFLDPDCPPVVAHLHMQALPANRNFVGAFGLKPIIMIRSLPDMLASYWDMLDADPSSRLDGLNCQIPAQFPQMSHDAKADFVTDILAPWYVGYFATWKSFADDAPDTVCVLRYDDFCNAPATALHAALTHAGFDVTVAACSTAIAKTWDEKQAYRFNKGMKGRGRDYLAGKQIGRIDRMLSFYPQLASWKAEILGCAQTAFRLVG